MWIIIMLEEWKAIKNYEDYLISNLGNVYSVKRNCYLKLEDAHGYNRVTLCKNGKHKKYFVHRLVAEAFIKNKENLPYINHKDENKKNNCVDNLEWCTHLYNIHYGTAIKRRIQSQLNQPSTAKKVYQFTKEGKYINEYLSIAEAARVNNLYKTNISSCCYKKYGCKTSGGYIWSFSPSLS